MAEILRPDLCVIGAGAGGLAVAAAARALGASVVLVERASMGGTDLNAGTVPSKALLESARHAHAMRSAVPFGIAEEEPTVHFGRVHDYVREVITGVAALHSTARFEALGVKVVSAEARFLDRRTLGAGETQIRARRFVIATGSTPALPLIPGLASVPYFTSDTIFENTRKPTHLVIIGAGPVGVEVAQAYRRLGAEVTIVEKAVPLSGSDPELAEIALRRLREEGILIRSKTTVTALARRGDALEVHIVHAGAEDMLTASHLMVATGRAAEFDSLDIASAGIKRRRDDATLLRLGRDLRTSNFRIYAIGDAAGGPQFGNLAAYQAGIVVRSALLGIPTRYEPDLVPSAIFTDPEIAEVGLTEPMARRRRKDNYRVLRCAFAENVRARTRRQTYGLAKLVTDRGGRILGAGIVGAEAGELIALFSFAISNRLSVHHLRNFVAPYPTLSEIAGQLAAGFDAGEVAHPWRDRLIMLNRLLP